MGLFQSLGSKNQSSGSSLEFPELLQEAEDIDRRVNSVENNIREFRQKESEMYSSLDEIEELEKEIPDEAIFLEEDLEPKVDQIREEIEDFRRKLNEISGPNPEQDSVIQKLEESGIKVEELQQAEEELTEIEEEIEEFVAYSSRVENDLTENNLREFQKKRKKFEKDMASRLERIEGAFEATSE